VIAAQKRLGLVVDCKVGTQTITGPKREAEPLKPGPAEPDKALMEAPAVFVTTGQQLDAYPPPNDHTLVLLDTAQPISKIIFHCTATPEGTDLTFADVRAWHKERGWLDIGYHYVIYCDERIMLGRPVG
jgi:N-acetylmuramoyl-L-alanine amidase